MHSPHTRFISFYTHYGLLWAFLGLCKQTVPCDIDVQGCLQHISCHIIWHYHWWKKLYIQTTTSTNKSQKTYTAAATVEYEEFGFHATSLTGNLNFTVRIHRPVDTSHSLRQQSCEPVINNIIWYNIIKNLCSIQSCKQIGGTVWQWTTI